MACDYRIAIAGGGTGGHLYPGLAIADFFRDAYPDCEIIFIGTRRGIEYRVVPDSGYQLYLLPVRGILRKFSLQNLFVPFRLIASLINSFLILRRFKPHIVIGTGGYVAGPPLMVAKFLGIATAIQEQNSYPGLVNRQMGNKVDLVFSAFAEAEKYLAGPRQFYLTGNPVRIQKSQDMRAQALEKYDLQENKTTLLVFGGSQGARKINETFAAVLPRLLQNSDLQVIWIVGPASAKQWQPLQEKFPAQLRVPGYVENMALVYSITDLAVCRSGAMTISELTLFGIPALFIPFPFATADHQTKNARSLVEAGAEILVHEKELTADILLKQITELLVDDAKRMVMKDKTRKLARPNATRDIVTACVALIDRESEN